MTDTKKSSLESLLNKVWNGDQKMVDHCLKNSTYVDMGKYYLKIADKPSITKTFWFRDQDYNTGEMLTAPKVTFKLFKSENLSSNTEQRWIEEIESGKIEVTIHTHYNSNDVAAIKGWTTKRACDEIRANGRLATEAEKKIILRELKKHIVAYNKRLVTYWKRYANKVSARTYWGDR